MHTCVCVCACVLDRPSLSFLDLRFKAFAPVMTFVYVSKWWFAVVAGTHVQYISPLPKADTESIC